MRTQSWSEDQTVFINKKEKKKKKKKEKKKK